MSEKRFVLDQDDDGHWYVVPVDRLEDWDNWLAISSDDERSWEVPKFAHEIGGSYRRITFSDWKDMCDDPD